MLLWAINLGQNEMEQQTHPSSRNKDGAARRWKHAIFPSSFRFRSVCVCVCVCGVGGGGGSSLFYA